MEHALHLGAGHFIQVVSPRSGRILVKKIKKAFHDAELDDDNIDFDALEADLGGDNNDADELTMTTMLLRRQLNFLWGTLSVNRLRWLNRSVRSNICKWLCADIGLQIRSSPQATAFFGQCCRQAGVPELKLMQWVCTRWASMHNFLERMLILQKVSNVYNTLMTSITFNFYRG